MLIQLLILMKKEKKYIEKNIYKILQNKIKNKIICFLGVTFKANTDDIRDSSAMNNDI